MEGLKWLVTLPFNVLVHILHVHVMENAVNVLNITVETEKYLDVSFQNLVRKLMIGQLKISTVIIKSIVKVSFPVTCL